MNESIQEKAPKPPGLLPKNVQSWLIIGLAILMVAIMWLTGGKKPPTAPRVNNAVQPVPLPAEVNETKINELQNRISELQREQLVAQNALTQQTRLLGVTPTGQPLASGQTPQPALGNGQPQQPAPEDVIQTERKKRAYLSLFASNVALSYRNGNSEMSPDSILQNQPSAPTSVTSSTEPAQIAEILRSLQPPVALPPVAPAQQPPITPTQHDPSGLPASNKNHEEKTDLKEAIRSAATSTETKNVAAGKNYVVFEGSILEAVLINRLEGQFAGPVECLLTTDVYSHDRQHLLIPAGTKAIGETRKVENSGQTRLAVVFHRLLMPDGYSVNLDQFKGLDQIGDTGLRDQVNNHYLRIFGVSLAIGALGALAEAGTNSGLVTSSSDLMRQGFAQSTAQSSAQILDKFLNILPTVTIREGHRVKIYLSGDLALPDYINHKMPSDL
jgi:type IV secretory pathway VirB10-like protein